jgi:hypothetical protein
MKKSLLIAFVVAIFAATTASAQLPVGGSISAYADVTGGSCLITISPGVVNTFYVVHIPPAGRGVTGATFSMPYPVCLTAVVTMFPFAANGATPPGSDVQTGISIGYGQCSTVPFMTGSQGFFPFGVPIGDCCLIQTQDAPNYAVAATDCGVPILDVPAQGGGGIINDATTPQCICNVADEDATWGGIKDLFGTD